MPPLHFRVNFNPRSHERSAPLTAPAFLLFEFQSTLPREERRVTIPFNLTIQNFNPRSHERSDKDIISLLQSIINFNPRSHERSDSSAAALPSLLHQFQSTLPREERREWVSGMRIVDGISIHAPTRGATYSFNCLYYILTISIHAPTRGATHLGYVMAL